MYTILIILIICIIIYIYYRNNIDEHFYEYNDIYYLLEKAINQKNIAQKYALDIAEENKIILNQIKKIEDILQQVNFLILVQNNSLFHEYVKDKIKNTVIDIQNILQKTEENINKSNDNIQICLQAKKESENIEKQIKNTYKPEETKFKQINALTEYITIAKLSTTSAIELHEQSQKYNILIKDKAKQIINIIENNKNINSPSSIDIIDWNLILP